MKVWGINRAGLDFALMLANADFAGNIKFHSEPKRRGREYLVSLRTQEPGPGANVYFHPACTCCDPPERKIRQTGPSVCWHAHRDFIRALFEINPDSRIKSILSDYKGQADFEARHESTKGQWGDCLCEM